MLLAPGNRLGPYEIIAPLGAGGMGEVFRARDSRLGRDVAIKVLPERLSSDDLRARFEREARTLSQLNHPHICTLHDVGRHDDVDHERHSEHALPEVDRALTGGADDRGVMDSLHLNLLHARSRGTWRSDVAVVAVEATIDDDEIIVHPRLCGHLLKSIPTSES